MRILLVLTLLLTGCQGYTCDKDADCTDGVACRPELDETRLDSVTGCVTRCEEDSDCASGFICLADGTCG
jgi:Cys-rich repeat protein